MIKPSCFFLFLVFTCSVNAVTLSEYLFSVEQNHPYMKALKESESQRKLATVIADSAFDINWKQSYDARVTGYYDGRVMEQQLTKALPYMNTKVEVGYQLADGSFPSYEGYLDTLSAGEVYISASMSLLQNSKIDKNRLAIRTSQIELNQWQYEKELLINDLLYKAVKAYLYWYQAQMQYNVVESLIDNNLKRKEAIEQRVQQGDMANFVLQEFETNILALQILLQSLEQQTYLAKQGVLYYYRGQNGEMFEFSELNKAPQQLDWPFTVTDIQTSKLLTDLKKHPRVSVLTSEIEQQKAKISLYENNLRPKLDLKAGIYQGIGSGAKSLDETDTKIGLKFSYPLGNRQAKAELATNESKLREMQIKKQLAYDAVFQQFEQSRLNLLQRKSMVNLLDKNVRALEQLFQAEKLRFDAGDTDMFVLNARQSKMIETKQKQIKASVEVLKAELELHFAASTLNRFN